MNQLFITFRDFWSQFKNPFTGRDVGAFQEGSVSVISGNTQRPPPFPYIVYPISLPSFAENAMINVTVWDKGSQPGFYPVINAIVEQISDLITEDGIILKLGDGKGAIWLQRGTPFVIYPPGDDRDLTIVRAVLNIVVRGYIA